MLLFFKNFVFRFLIGSFLDVLFLLLALILSELHEKPRKKNGIIEKNMEFV